MQLSDILNLAVVLTFFIFWLTAFFIIYHLARFGIGLLPKRLAALFLVGAIVLFSTTLLFYSPVNINSYKL